MTMALHPIMVIAIFVLYMAFLFGIAFWAEQKTFAMGRNLVESPWVYSLSLAVYCTSWTFYGSVGKAATSGFMFLSIYIGPTLGIILWWTVLRKLVRIKSNFRITSIADFISARYNKSQSLAMLATLGALIGIAPYVALQLKAVITTFNIISDTGGEGNSFAEGNFRLIIVCLMITFTILFGVRHIDPTERHRGVVFAVAVESLVKLVAFLVVGIYVTFFLFNGFGDIFSQFEQVSETFTLFGPGSNGYTAWMSWLFMSMVAFIVLPRQFHISVVENADERHILSAMGILPVYLLLINLFVMPLSMAGILYGLPLNEADDFVLRLFMILGHKNVTLLVFLGGFSAATSMIVISAMTLSTMITNHLVLPVIEQIKGLDVLKRYVLQLRWASVAVFILVSYWFERVVGESYMLVNIGIISFAAAMQFAPAIFFGIFWTRANKTGAVMGLFSGFAIWFYTMFVPALARSGWIPHSLISEGFMGVGFLKPEQLFGMTLLDPVSHCVFWSMFFNISLFLFGSLFFEQKREERDIALAFVQSLEAVESGSVVRKTGVMVSFLPKKEKILELLSHYFPQIEAEAIFNKCLLRSGFQENGAIPITQLSSLVNEIEKTLSGSFGAAMAHRILIRSRIYTPDEQEKLKGYYSELLAKMHVSPEELRKKIDYYQEREALLSHHSKELEEEIQERKKAQEALKKAHDQLEEKVAERTMELARAKEEAESAARVKGDFMARMSHEIRTPMNAIIGLTALVLKTNLSETQSDYIEKVNDSSVHLLNLVNDILDFSKLESGKMTLEMKKFMLHHIITRVANMFRVKAAEKSVELFYIIEKDVPLALKGDPFRIGQVLINLVGNAVKFTSRGEVVVTVKLDDNYSPPDENKVGLLFSVKDTGIGIARDKMKLLFQPFTQTDGFVTRKYGGTGLGLSISHHLVTSMGGKIWVKSKLHKGSVFYFTLAFEENQEENIRHMYPPADIRGLKALVVDDNQTACLIIEKMLKSFEFRVVTADSPTKGHEVLRAAVEEDPFDFMVLDWKMPEMDGFELARAIQEDSFLIEHDAIPKIIMITIYDQEELVEANQRSGKLISNYLLKPLSSSELFNSIMEVFSKKEAMVPKIKEDIKQADPGEMEKVMGSRILLVEDNYVNQLVAMSMLGNKGAMVEAAENGKIALDMLQSRLPDYYDLVLMDLEMPVMDGYTATQKIREDRRFKNLPVVAMTAHVLKGEHEKCLEAGLNDFVPKPVDEWKLYTTVAKWIKHRSFFPARPNGGIETKFWENIPESIPGIDMVYGLGQVKGNKGLYRNMLLNFRQKFETAGRQIKHWMEKSEFRDAKFLVHSIKGVSSNIGATTLFRASRDLELMLARQDIEGMESGFEIFKQSLDLVMESLKAVDLEEKDEPDANVKKSELDLAAIFAVLDQLRSHLEKHSAKARHSVEDLKKALKGVGFDDALSSLNKAVYRLDTDKALDLVRLLTIKIETTLQGRER